MRVKGLVRAFAVLAITLLTITGCVNSNSPQVIHSKFGPGSVVIILRGQFNQPSLQVKKAASGSADLVLMRAFGYVQALDRLLQMDVSRRMARGRLSELFAASPEAEEKDRALWGLGLPQAVDKKTRRYIQEFPEAYQWLEAFSEGVNLYISELSERDPVLLEKYRKITRDSRYMPSPWEPADTLGVAQSISFYLSSRIQEKLNWGMVSMAPNIKGGDPVQPTTVSMNADLDLRPLYEEFILAADSKSGWPSRLNALKHRGSLLVAPVPRTQVNRTRRGITPVSLCRIGYPLPPCEGRAVLGSNNLVVSGEFSGSGKVLLGNDPHLWLGLPMTFYEAALDAKPSGGTVRTRGFTLPGLLVPLIGHNDYFAFGMTNLAFDVDDIYLEYFDETGNRTRTVDKKGNIIYVEMTHEDYLLPVRGPDGVVVNKRLRIRYVPNHGPVFTDHFPDLQDHLRDAGKIIEEKVAGSYRWVGHRPSAEFEAQRLMVTRATNFTEFKEALKLWEAGAQNILYGGKDGDIGYYAHGKFPIRPYLTPKRLPIVPVVPPKQGGTPQDWAGFRPSAEAPQVFNPSSGRIVTANNDPFGHTLLPHKELWKAQNYHSVWFAPGARAARIAELLDKNRGGVDEKLIQEIQLDHKDGILDKYLTLLGKHLDKLSIKPDFKTRVKQLLDWDRRVTTRHTEPVLASIWLEELLRTYADDYLRGSSEEYASNAITKTFLLISTVFHKLEDWLGSDDEFDRSSAIELLEVSLQRAEKEFKARQWEGKRWGEINRLEFANLLEGILPSFVSLPFERDGFIGTVDVSVGPVGPGIRVIFTVEAGKPIQATASVAGGNFDGDDRDGLYRELLPWLRGEYRGVVEYVSALYTSASID